MSSEKKGDPEKQPASEKSGPVPTSGESFPPPPPSYDQSLLSTPPQPVSQASYPSPSQPYYYPPQPVPQASYPSPGQPYYYPPQPVPQASYPPPGQPVYYPQVTQPVVQPVIQPAQPVAQPVVQPVQQVVQQVPPVNAPNQISVKDPNATNIDIKSIVSAAVQGAQQGQQNQTVQNVQTVQTVQKTQASNVRAITVPKSSFQMRCPNCRQQVYTVVHYEDTAIVWLLCIILFCFTGILCFIPFLIPSLKDAIHYCPICRRELARA